MNRYAVAIILRAELRAWRNRITKGNPVRVVGLALFALFAGIVFGGSLFGIAFAAGEALPSARDAILAGAFTALSVMMLVVGFPSATGAGLYLAWNLTIRQSSTAIKHRPDFSNLVSTLQRLDWLPSAWPGHALTGVINGDAGLALAWTALTFVLAAVLSLSAAFLYESTLLAGLGRVGGVPSRVRNRSLPQPGGAPTGP